MNSLKKHILLWICTQNHVFQAILGLTIIFQKGVASKRYVLVRQIWSQKLRNTWRKSHETSWQELVALRRYCAKRLGGADSAPQAWLGLMLCSWQNMHIRNILIERAVTMQVGADWSAPLKTLSLTSIQYFPFYY